MFRILNKSSIPLSLHKKSNHIFTVWQHIVLLVLRQYENKSYRMFSEWLVEAYYLRMSLQLSHIPHYTTVQIAARISSGTILDKIILSSFILLLLNYVNSLFIGIDSSWFKVSIQWMLQNYTDQAKLRKMYLKLSLSADLLSQIICMYCQNKTSSYKTR